MTWNRWEKNKISILIRNVYCNDKKRHNFAILNDGPIVQWIERRFPKP